jgi:NAD(P)-dependent dehydrogenase (short-subunit alcohol dehydrogenase family)
MPEEDWDAVVDTNLRGAGWWRRRRALGGGQRPGHRQHRLDPGLRTIGQVAPHNASKAAFIHLTRASPWNGRATTFA